MTQLDVALGLFFPQHQALIRCAAGVVGERSQAKDLLQEAWLRYSAVAADWTTEGPAGYLHRIVRNLMLDGHQERRGLGQRILDANSEPVAQTLPSDESYRSRSAASAAHQGKRATSDALRPVSRGRPVSSRVEG